MVKNTRLIEKSLQAKKKKVMVIYKFAKKRGRGLIPRSDAYELRYVKILKTICQ